jgi:translation initiation factor 2 alpha subunit (eIF-2alpha)
MELENGDVVLCTVERIVGTTVFVDIEGNGQGSIILSEVAAGRIRNLRDYVVPKKKIVCKVIRISPNGNIDLSLRRVTPKEQKEVLEKAKQEKSYENIIKSVLGDKSDIAISEMKKEGSLYDFFDEAKEEFLKTPQSSAAAASNERKSKELEKIVGKSDAKKILEILLSQKSKKAVLKKEFRLVFFEPNGIEIVKELLENLNAEVKYLSAGKYSVKIEADNLKIADNQFKEIISVIENKAKKLGAEFKVL